ncbi:hypothetical protein [Nostoc sp. FACHB-190]|uniref:hypothetical protein n=1 Tax=Nostoc sp. FACHB-190 TaxID=2692838 RepID=UPI0016824889|nr:hypothetical protein [Nostoc sp. FACHB-190]MBD2303850.1 hypothetical protein [Nostoc sp. FACHB-190]
MSTLLDSINFLFQILQYIGEIDFMKMSSIKSYAILIPVLLSIISLIFALTTSSKVPIRITLTAPSLKLMVEINYDRLPSRLNFLQDAEGVLIASDRQ